jgi:transmembrane sensor
MSEVHRIPDVEVVEREASEWIARLNADDATPEDRARFEAWAARHLLHARAYEDLSRTYQELVNAGPWVRAVSFAQSMNEAAVAQAPHVFRGSARRRWILAGAAALVLIALSATFYVKPWSSNTLYTTAIGEHATVSLPDGSTLELNSNSAASVEYSKAVRVIHLRRGEAFFSVTHDAQRPFWVVGGGSWVRAVGTAFNVYLKTDDVLVTVSEGTVKVGSAEPLSGGFPSDTALAGTPITVLTAGEQADLRGSATATRKLSSAEMQRSVTWREGTVYFENQPLSDVVEELGRYTTVHLVIDDENVRHLPVGGTFQASPQGTEALLTMLEQGFGLTVRRESDRVLIGSPERSPAH